MIKWNEIKYDLIGQDLESYEGEPGYWNADQTTLPPVGMSVLFYFPPYKQGEQSGVYYGYWIDEKEWSDDYPPHIIWYAPNPEDKRCVYTDVMLGNHVTHWADIDLQSDDYPPHIIWNDSKQLTEVSE